MDEQVQDDNQRSDDQVLDIDQLQQHLTDAQAEAEKNLNNWKRSEADFRNYQTRKENENKELVEFAREVTVAKLLPTLDSLEQGLKHAPELNPSVSASAEPPSLGREGESDAATEFSPHSQGGVPSHQTGGGGFEQKYQTWLNGINGLVKQLDKALTELGVKKIEALGKKFDPHFHEAVREVPGDEDGVVVEEYQSGFELSGKVIRPSQVAISKKG